MKNKKRKTCATCGSNDFLEIIKFGKVPLAGNFTLTNEKTKTYDLNLIQCKKCKLVQTDYIIHPDTLFKDYRYSSSVSLQNHFNDLAEKLNIRFNIKDKFILDIGCNDGVLLEPLNKLGANAWGIDPASNITKIGRQKGLLIFDNYFNLETAVKYPFEKKFDIITCCNTFAHIDDIISVLQGIKYCLKPDGIVVIEVHYLGNLINEFQYDNIYHEHMYYYSMESLRNFMNLYDMKIFDIQTISNHSGSLRVFATHKESKKYESFDGYWFEKDIDLLKFKEEFEKRKNEIQYQLKNFKKSSNYLIGYGASGRAVMFCNMFKINNKILDYIIDESPERYGRFIPNTGIPIYPPSKLDEIKDKENTYVLITAWNYLDTIINKIRRKGFSNFIVAFPKFKLISDE